MGGFNKKTVKDINLKGKTVLVRADYNVPIENGKIMAEYRIRQSLPTIQYLLDQDCAIIICSHLGRPEGKVDPKYSLAPVAKWLDKHLGRHVFFVNDCVGPVAQAAAADAKPGTVVLLENLRFHPEEEANDAGFAKQLASLADVFVQDGFGVVHHGAVSVSEMPKYLPSAAGLLLEKEVTIINRIMSEPKRPLVAVIGGAKISDKIGVMNKLIDVADVVAVGGAMANTFLLAERIDIGKSLADHKELSLARDIMDKARAKAKKQSFVFYLPQDGVVASKIDKSARTRIVEWQTGVIADIENYPKHPPRSSGRVLDNESILDIGPFSGAFIAGSIQLAATVIWSGTMGVTETPAVDGPIGPFAHGTELIVESLLGKFGHRPYSFVGGGDTVGYVEQRGLTDSFDHVSTGGGASLELMSGNKLPGVEALPDK